MMREGGYLIFVFICILVQFPFKRICAYKLFNEMSKGAIMTSKMNQQNCPKEKYYDI
jgi:hypothetical protein